MWSRSMPKSLYQLEHSLEDRQEEALKLKESYPDRIPVIVEKAEGCDFPQISKKKHLVPLDMTAGVFACIIRKKIELSAEKAIFIFANSTLPSTSSLMSLVHKEHKAEDGFLYITYSGENTFGAVSHHQ